VVYAAYVLIFMNGHGTTKSYGISVVLFLPFILFILCRTVDWDDND
jgi:hypothetical protein